MAKGVTMNLSIVRKIFLGVVAIQVVTAIVILGWFYYSLRSEVDQLVESNALDTVLRSISVTEEYVRPVETALQSAQNLISNEVLHRDRPEQLVRYLHGQLRAKPYFAGVYVGFPDGAFYYVMRSDEGGTRTKIITFPAEQRTVTLTWRDADYSKVKSTEDPQDAYDPRTRPWYRAALQTDEITWTEPYIFFTSRNPGVTAALAVDNDPTGPRAVIGIDIEISEISRHLRQIALSPSRPAFIVGGEGEVISHSGLDTVLSDKLAEDGTPRFIKLAELEGVDQSVLDAITARLASRSATAATMAWKHSSDGGDYLIAMGRATSANWPWQIVAILPESDIIGVAKGRDFVLIGFVVLATVLAVVIGFLLARNIGQPLVVLWTNAKLARNGNVELMSDVASGYKEIDETAAILLELAEKKRREGSSSA